MSLTIAYITARKDCRIEWFIDSLTKQLRSNLEPPQVIVVDHHLAIRDSLAFATINGNGKWLHISHVAPKPNVWNGPHRLTKQDWFAAASMRNTAICLAPRHRVFHYETATGGTVRYPDSESHYIDGHIAFVDDLSVLMPGWLDAVYEAVEGNYIACGAYKKVRNLKVVDGVPVGYDETDGGMDDRLRRVTEDVSPCTGGWLYGCSMVAPLEDLLEVGGFPEICDGLGSEDYCLGIALTNAGKHLKYDRRMMTLESEELHFKELPMKRTDKGISPNDKSHAVLNIAKTSKYFPNYYEGGIRALRDHVLAGNPFPVIQRPQHDWFDGQPIGEM